MYRYADRGDAGAHAVTQHNGAELSDWNDQDARALRLLAGAAADHSANTCLDVGAGEGRLFGPLSDLGWRLSVVEPDEERLRTAIASASRASIPLLDIRQSIARLPKSARFQLINVAYVIQHLDDTIVRILLKDAAAHLQNEGAFMTIFYPEAANRTKWWVDEEGLAHKDGNDRNSFNLVIHRTRQEMTSLLGQSDLQIISDALVREFMFNSSKNTIPLRASDVGLKVCPC